MLSHINRLIYANRRFYENLNALSQKKLAIG